MAGNNQIQPPPLSASPSLTLPLIGLCCVRIISDYMTVLNYCHTVFFPSFLSVPRLVRWEKPPKFSDSSVCFPSFFHQGHKVANPMPDGIAHIERSNLPTSTSPWSCSWPMAHLTFSSMIHTPFSKHWTALLSSIFVSITKYDLSKCFAYKIPRLCYHVWSQHVIENFINMSVSLLLLYFFDVAGCPISSLCQFFSWHSIFCHLRKWSELW